MSRFHEKNDRSGKKPIMRNSRLPAFVLTPDDVDRASFKSMFHGRWYAADEVDEFLDQVITSLAWLEKTTDFIDPSELFDDGRSSDDAGGQPDPVRSEVEAKLRSMKRTVKTGDEPVKPANPFLR